MKRDFEPVRCHIPTSSASAGGATLVVGKVVEPRWAVTEISVVGRAGMEAADTGKPACFPKCLALHHP